MSKVVHIKPKGRLFNFSATAREAKSTTLQMKGAEQQIVAPTVFYAPTVWDQLWYIVAKCPKEVGWLGLVEPIYDGAHYLITDLYVPEQTVSGTETDIDSDALAELAMELIDAGRDTSKLFYWGHSHVNMDVGPSSQDEDQVDEYLEHNSVFIRGIYNKRGSSKVDVFDKNAGVVHQCVANRPFTPGLTVAEATRLDQLLKDNVSERVYVNRHPNYQTPTRTPTPATPALSQSAQAAYADFYGDDEEAIYGSGWNGADAWADTPLWPRS